MNLTNACLTILGQLNDLLAQLEDRDFSTPVDTLGGSTIGQHLRHTLEFFICLEQGCACGTINYDKRSHDRLIETDKELAMAAIQRVSEFITSLTTDYQLTLEVGYDTASDAVAVIPTSYQRELVYNIEHAVHHMALIKIGVRAAAPYVSLPESFGVAASTMRYKESTAGPR